MHPRGVFSYLFLSKSPSNRSTYESARLVKGATDLIESRISVLFFVHFYYMLNKSIFTYYFSQLKFITRLRRFM